MNIEDITIGQLKALKGILGDPQQSRQAFPAEPSEKVLIRTVTVYHVGRVVKVEGGYVHLEGASWVADTGRFGESLRTGTLNEVEYVDQVAISLSAVVDVFPWRHDLPSKSA
jgi:hypothetical protein